MQGTPKTLNLKWMTKQEILSVITTFTLWKKYLIVISHLSDPMFVFLCKNNSKHSIEKWMTKQKYFKLSKLSIIVKIFD